MPSGEQLKSSVQITGARQVLTMLNGLGPATNDAIRAESGVIGAYLATRMVQAAAKSLNHQARLLAKTVKVSKDRVPVLSAGGTQAVARGSRKGGTKTRSASAILFATEFGLGGTKPGHGFQRHQGQHSYWFLATVDQNASVVAQMWQDAVGRVLLAANQTPTDELDSAS